MSPNAGVGGGGVAGSQPLSIQLYTGAQINFWRSNSIFNLWMELEKGGPSNLGLTSEVDKNYKWLFEKSYFVLKRE